MNRLEQFLSSAARSMRIMPAAVRDDELRELRGHLEQRVEDFVNQGMSADEAQTQAIAGLGSPRALGSRLCDAWEGIPFGWWRLAAAIAGVTAFLMFGVALFMLSLITLPLHAEIALLPEITPLLWTFYLAMPLTCGVLFSHWLGRRGCLVATLYFLALALGNMKVTFPTSSEHIAAPPAIFLHVVNAPWFAYFCVVLAFVGAWSEHRWRMQKRYQMALVGSDIVSPKRVLWVPLNLKWWRNALLLTAVASAIYAGRVWLEFHPQTPRATLQNVLLTASPQDFDAPEILELRELPSATAAERAGKKRRIHFRVAARAKLYFAASQIQHLERQIASQKRTGYGDLSSTKATLARVKNNRQVVEGTMTMVKTKRRLARRRREFSLLEVVAMVLLLTRTKPHQPIAACD